MILVTGLPGNMAQTFVEEGLKAGVIFSDFSLASEKHNGEIIRIGDAAFSLLPPKEWTAALGRMNRNDCVIVDYTRPDSALSNIEFYCKNNFNFVIGTTGFDLIKAKAIIEESRVCAVVAFNMGLQIVALQSLLESAKTNTPGVFEGYSLKVVESHQKKKVDRSGVGTVISKQLMDLGARMGPDDFVSVREPEQQLKMGIPESALSGHGYHTYTLTSPDGSNEIVISHNVRGRKVYAHGTLKAIEFLKAKIKAGDKGKAYSMIDVVRG